MNELSSDEKSRKLGEALARLRDGLQGLQPTVEAIDRYLSSFTELEETTTVKEETFTILKFEPAKGERLGEFETAHKSNNLPDKWNHAYNILRQNNAVINSRYHGPDYEFSYWLYDEDRIFRQKRKQ